MRVRACMLAVTAVLLACAAPASANVFSVNTTADNGNLNCQGTGPCSLRGAVTEANRNPGPDTINVPAGRYVVDAQLAISSASDVTITGASAATTTIAGSGASRVFQVTGAQSAARLRHVTVADGLPMALGVPSNGGNFFVTQGAELTLSYARVTNGEAARGGGIFLFGGVVLIDHSVIDGNRAVNVPAAGVSGEGGGIASAAMTQPATLNDLEITDSTIVNNSAQSGAGVITRDSANNITQITRSTIAFNSSTVTAGGGLFILDNEPVGVTGSIIANNTGNVGQAAVVIAPSNCGGAVKPQDGRFNVESVTDCNFFTTFDRQNAGPHFGTFGLNGGETPLLPILAGSAATDLIPIGAAQCTGSITDQRNVARPIGAGCDAGAFEADFVPPAVSIDSGPSGAITDTTASFSFSSSEPGSTFDCRLDGPSGQGIFAPCTSPKSFSGLAPGGYVFFVRATDAAGNTSTATSRAFTVTAPPPPPPTPVPGKSVVIQPVSGKTLVKLPGAKAFEPVDTTRGIPDGSTVDTRHGKIRLFAIPTAGRPVENALFYGGIFKLKLSGGITELRLTEALSCPSAKAAQLAAKKPKTRKLWGDGSGSFRTRGQYSAATVRGTKWLVQDFCGKTLTRVAKGVVSVNDFVKHKTILLRAPHRYTARQKH